jgi:carboxypeptidase PM20D1
MPGVRGNFAMIGIGEKGRANVKFIARGKGGHASTPRKHSPIARLAAFVCAVEKHSPFRSEMEPATRSMLEAMAPGAALPFRIVLQNLGIFQKPIELVTPRISGQAAAMLGTTITFTMASGSAACNVFPAQATLGANMRFVHHQDMEESLEVMRRIAAKYDLEMEVVHGTACTRMIDYKGEVYRYVADTAAKTFPGCISSPYILTAATDATFYDEICDNCIRFAPIVYGQEEKKGIHGVNEALRYDCLPGAVDFFKNLIKDNHKGG